ncbi:MAG: maleylpyruvate isomerase N-terminal domain-containing protein [Anaerolineaceae bacterium]|nr:maleylpyruvate isomerase N-terminal domain-containing protein [Anaerolineaceae bacterium]MCB9102267.1 maleylpyruvate isomerase N-terminal domain-containing protein [Anaerolineales bacterium]
MNAHDVIRYGHETVLTAIDGLPKDDWLTPGVCGFWSVKDIIAHLASFEVALVDVLRSLTGETSTPMLQTFIETYPQFNDTQVELRRHKTADEVLAEYMDAYEQAAALLPEISPELCRQNGTLAWYGEQYDLDDFILYTFYGHKREHCAQINVFRDTLSS